FQPTISTQDLLGADGATPKTNAETDLSHHYQQICKNGYENSEGEFDPRVMAIAAPILLRGTTFGAVSVLGPPSYMTPQTDQIVRATLQSADQIGAALRSDSN